jgi:hypothetical protein
MPSDLVLTERFEKVTGRKAIVVFSDGVDTASILASKEDVINHVPESGTLVYSIRFNTIADLGGGRAREIRVPERIVALYADAAGFLMSLADQSGGRFYDVDNIKDTTQAFVNIARRASTSILAWILPFEPGDRWNISQDKGFSDEAGRSRQSKKWLSCEAVKEE